MVSKCVLGTRNYMGCLKVLVLSNYASLCRLLEIHLFYSHSAWMLLFTFPRKDV
ncbi:hypothetical protein BHE74_00035028 [Ensete ventricosum]|uniref:Uncharacterized protein n=1 Tax=Ensete ventricosum TaxID=4639 RepID=A0A444FA12_ENSVE|nr:hypothetical protein B296_00046388 [Ensete ventricosum]RWW19492.1 hypothetical protein GW17_00016449 [Ensete ventricosum]RWW58139.1 hypothetical protein BHE74_00035028 [Ensete ventricosum]RZS14796.1 hypothetical protein BHM03_00046538 [Ensete ventricosum]